MIYILHEVELFLGREKDGRFGGLIRETGKKRDSRRGAARFGKDRKYYITAGDGKDDQHIVCKGHEKCITKLNELTKAFSKEVFGEE